MSLFKFVYYCLSDEIGENKTPHTHIFFYCLNAVYFNTVKKRFPFVHIDIAKGTCQENRDYLRKEGKYLNSDKKETNLIETFEEYGTMPLETSEKNTSVSSEIVDMIKNGSSNIEIIEKFPSAYNKVKSIDALRQEYLYEKYSNEWRDIEIFYIYGETGTGKTRYVMEKYGYSNVYKITDYAHPFDRYNGEPVILFDEFRSSLPIVDMLQYLDGYPCRLPARYEDKTACFTAVYIVSNIPLDKQYPHIQTEESETWKSFVRRINSVEKYEKNNGSLPFSENETIKIEISPNEFLVGGDNIV